MGCRSTFGVDSWIGTQKGVYGRDPPVKSFKDYEKL